MRQLCPRAAEKKGVGASWLGVERGFKVKQAAGGKSWRGGEEEARGGVRSAQRPRPHAQARSRLDVSKERACQGGNGRIKQPPLPLERSSGLGHGMAHSAFFFLSLLTAAVGLATYYANTCPEMPFFLVASVASLAFLLLHTFGMVVAFDGYATHTKAHQLAVPALHLTAALLMLVNFAPGGCAAGVCLVWICAAAMIALCARAAWERTGHSITLDTPLRPPRPRPPGS
eukprot:jgi/Mesen1/8377/ME000468S07815